MIYLAIWLIALGVSDLLRARSDRVGGWRVIAVAVVGVNVLFGLLLAVSPSALIATLVTTASGAGLVLYIVASAAALNQEGNGTRDRWVALGALLGSVLLLFVTSGRAAADGGTMQRWYDGLAVPALSQLPLETFLLGLGLFVVQLSTASIVVRLVLDCVGAPADPTLKGARLVGPMERVLVLGLAIAGSLTAVAVAIAAVGLLRYQMLQAVPVEAGPRRAQQVGYFLVGSLVSVLIALAGVPLL